MSVDFQDVHLPHSTSAAGFQPNFGASRWQLSKDFTSLAYMRDRGLMSVVGPTRACRPPSTESTFWGRAEVSRPEVHVPNNADQLLIITILGRNSEALQHPT